jgi:hypothetical protein
MKLLTDTWRQLVQRRLWPVALLLLGALVAVPFVLAKDPEPAAPVAAAPAPAPASAGGVKATAASAEPIVSMVSDDEKQTTRRSLGARHNPFASSAPKKKVSKAKAETAQSPSSTDTSQDSSSGAGAGSGGASAPTTPTGPSVPAQPMETVPAQSLLVGFGSSSSDELGRQRLARNEALSTDDPTPIVVYLGTKNNGKTAIFMVSEGFKAVGDGKCVPADTCEKIELNVGETEFFQAEGDSDSSEWELDLVKIYKHATKVPATDGVLGSPGTGSSDTGVLG